MSGKESFADSFTDAFKISNIFYKFLMFLIFGVATALPYLVNNFDKVSLKVSEQGLSGTATIFAYLLALSGAVKTGFFIGLSTVFDTLLNINTVLGDKMYGTLGFSIIVFIFGTLAIVQPTKLVLNIVDMQKGRKHSALFAFLVSAVLVFIIISPLSWLILGGETITSGMIDSANKNLPGVDDINELINVSNEMGGDMAIINLLEDNVNATQQNETQS